MPRRLATVRTKSNNPARTISGLLTANLQRDDAHGEDDRDEKRTSRDTTRLTSGTGVIGLAPVTLRPFSQVTASVPGTSDAIVEEKRVPTGQSASSFSTINQKRC